eukprot:492326-Rhodomonas_salina.1
MGLELAAIMAGKEVPKAMAKEFSRIGAPTPDFAVIGNMLNKFLLNTFNLHKPVSRHADRSFCPPSHTRIDGGVASWLRACGGF